MKIFTTVMKIVAALAAVAGVIYVIATYGDKIVAWAKKMLKCADECCCCCECEDGECCCECEDGECCCECEEVAEEAEAPTEEVQAEAADFEA